MHTADVDDHRGVLKVGVHTVERCAHLIQPCTLARQALAMIGRGDAQTLRITTVRHELSDLVERKPRRFDTGAGFDEHACYRDGMIA